MRWPFQARSQEAAAPHSAHEWASQPPIQRVTADIALTAPTQPFLGSLGARRRPELALAPLGHDVTLHAPQGIASGIARTYEARVDRTPLESRWQRVRSRVRGIAPSWP